MFELVIVLFILSLWVIASFVSFLPSDDKNEVDKNEK